MRLVYGSALALAVATLASAAIAAQGARPGGAPAQGAPTAPAAAGAQAETARAVAGGGITVTGWTGKIDANEEKAGQTLNNAKLAP